MKIRSITVFVDPGWPVDPLIIQEAGQFTLAARQAYAAAGYEIQTTRLATVPFCQLLPGVDLAVPFGQELEHLLQPFGCEYVSIGPALPSRMESYAVIPQVIASTRGVFVSGMMTTADGEISLKAVYACAEVIEAIARLTPDGFANLRFGAAANVAAGGPFFPLAYHARGGPSFALALQSADLAVTAVTGATSLAGARQALIAAIEGHAQRLEVVSRALEALGPMFGGFDFTLAPFPSLEDSFGTAIERLGVPAVGLHGSLAAAAFLTSTLDQARYPRAGFNGILLPVLEDAVLAQRAAQGTLGLKDLLLYATVCGQGLDTIPLPGDTTREQLAAILLDVAVLAQRLNKPLMARLMPIPGKQAGQATEFDFAYFANSRILSVEAAPLQGLLTGTETFPISSRSCS